MLCFPLLLFITRFYIIFHISAASPLQQTCDLRAPLLSEHYVYTRRRFRFRVSLHRRICNEFYGTHVHRFRPVKRNSISAALTVMPVKSTKEKNLLWGTYILDKKQSRWKTMVYFSWIGDTTDLIHNRDPHTIYDITWIKYKNMSAKTCVTYRQILIVL